MVLPAALHLSDRFHNEGEGLWWRSAPIGVLPHGTAPSDHATAVEWAQAQPGHFAAVIHTDQAIHLVSDFCRSIPLFYARVGDTWVVSDDINVMLSHLPEPVLDDEAAEVFRHCTVVLGDRTLVESVSQVPAATVVTLSADSVTPRTALYRHFSYTFDYEGREDEFENLFVDALRDEVGKVVETAGQRLLALPLSGGIDSRLLAILLAEHPEANLLAFTYGQKDSHEAKVSEQVARNLGIPWVFVESEPEAVHQAWNAAAHAFVRDCWAGASLPHYQDWYALHVLTQNGELPPGSIIMPGHTVVGNLHDEDIVKDPSPMSAAQMAKLLTHHHGGVQGTPDALTQVPYYQALMHDFFAEVSYDGSQEKRQDVIEWFNLRERQAKYINNSMRPYEHFDLDWAMPMLNASIVDLWQRGSHITADEERLWYKNLTNRLYAAATGGEIEYFTSTVGKLPPRWKQVGITVADKTGLSAFLRRSLSAKAQINHPMAFHALLPDRHASKMIISRTLKGSSLQGEFVDRFLTNTWLPGEAILPPRRGTL